MVQAYFEPEQAFSMSMSQPVFETSIAYEKKHVILLILLVTWKICNEVSGYVNYRYLLKQAKNKKMTM